MCLRKERKKKLKTTRTRKKQEKTKEKIKETLDQAERQIIKLFRLEWFEHIMRRTSRETFKK